MHGFSIGAGHSVGVSGGVTPGSRGPGPSDPHAPVIPAPPKPHTSTPSIAQRRPLSARMQYRIARRSAGGKARQANQGAHDAPGNRASHNGDRVGGSRREPPKPEPGT